ncbi:PadR family transcriptional regulator [Corynebacterium sp. ES2794-CONJ1]|uniref:PadR family transcriptional regulator n=1 Tax=unclassified Corynebacterium TaxID=2624378 RepID=UPI002169DECF|nr:MULTISPECIES: PadR family transcriptional regulator [unclassified Corynebacterium]MCS4490032.1 PadR family transcriptional regulator [Corynebacterium sp. ES2775-CONJ]MCS4491606.1 PadR family transcriptional regulator [Corynebacterium sp. ES2715-CONJ3]MCS4531710.1 PadR family transcriptional regulator [Corynebacterium sp. ES2730-CONJ]MCU9519106.1 PadR family transcriptional regulator [Corynebacterium sp. ES2794-CONJ1]
MAIKQALLALLLRQRLTPSQLQAQFLELTDHTQTLNMGQVTQTLKRLERDQLITAAGPITGANGHQSESYLITEQGAELVREWFRRPVSTPLSERDELETKIYLAIADPSIDLIDLLDNQRSEILGQLRILNKQARELPHQRLPRRLLIEHRIYTLEAQARWLDRIESLHPCPTHQGER